MKKIVILISSIILEINCYSQLLPMYSQYMENIFIINPAVAGNDGLTIFNISNRTQWLGITDAPRTSSISVQGRILKRKGHIKNPIFSKHRVDKDKFVTEREGKVGLGCYIFNDKNALIGRTDFQFAYAYHTFLRGSTELSFGLGLSVSQFKLDRDRIIDENPYDPILYSDASKTTLIPNANVGVYILNRNYFVGLSALQLLTTSIKLKNNAFNNYQLFRQYFLIAGYNYYLNADFTLVPSVLVRSTDYISTIQSDITLRIFYKKSIWAGVSYRTNNDFVAMIGFNYKKIFFSYSFDYPNNPIRQPSYGTNEFSVSIKLGNAARKFKWLDRY